MTDGMAVIIFLLLLLFLEGCLFVCFALICFVLFCLVWFGWLFFNQRFFQSQMCAFVEAWLAYQDGG